MKKGHVIGTEVLQAAQDAKGLSNERLAREIPVSERTWRRWKDIGEVPTYFLAKVAAVLDLEIQQPAKQRVLAANGSATPPEEEAVLEALTARMDGFETRLDRILALLEGAQEE